jgi:hypothetical protein
MGEFSKPPVLLKTGRGATGRIEGLALFTGRVNFA